LSISSISVVGATSSFAPVVGPLSTGVFGCDSASGVDAALIRARFRGGMMPTFSVVERISQWPGVNEVTEMWKIELVGLNTEYATESRG
jgi:hypothetical protein